MSYAASESSFGEILTPTSTLSISAQPTTVTIQDPATFAGQQLDAVLAVKHLPKQSKFCSAVGDLIRVDEHQATSCTVHNFRQDINEKIPWSAFFPLEVGVECRCKAGDCFCVKANVLEYQAR